MMQTESAPTRFIGLDVHKRYLVAAGVDTDRQPVLDSRRVQLSRLEEWMDKHLTPGDAVVLEMTTNSFHLHDLLTEKVHSVTIVHPPHVALITRAQVKTDRKAANALAQLHAAGLLSSIWVPTHDVRDLRALVAQRSKMVRLSTQARNRLHSLLHRKRLGLPETGGLFDPQNRSWWLQLPLSPLEKVCVRSDLDTLQFAQSQVELLEEGLRAAAARDDRVPLLIQLPGIALISAITLLAAIGDIHRFPSHKHLVGYSGLGARVHDSGQTHRTGRITKSGRRDIRATMVEAAHTASRCHPHWKAELARLEPHLGKNKAIVAIARKLLVAVWHVLSKECADRHAIPELVARSFLQHAYRLKSKNRPDDQSVPAYVREQLDRLGIGSHLTHVHHGNRPIALPPSRLSEVQT